MGRHYKEIGYGSAKAMYDDFSTGYRAQLNGFFKFITSAEAKPGLLKALQDRDAEEIARLYSGSKTYNNNFKTFRREAGL